MFDGPSFLVFEQMSSTKELELSPSAKVTFLVVPILSETAAKYHVVWVDIPPAAAHVVVTSDGSKACSLVSVIASLSEVLSRVFLRPPRPCPSSQNKEMGN